MVFVYGLPMSDLSALYIIRTNIAGLLTTRHQSQVDLASWLRKDKSWINKFLNGTREIQLKDLDRIADFFGLATYQLFQPGVVPVDLEDMVYCFEPIPSAPAPVGDVTKGRQAPPAEGMRVLTYAMRRSLITMPSRSHGTAVDSSARCPADGAYRHAARQMNTVVTRRKLSSCVIT